MLSTWSISSAQQLYLVTLAPRNPDIALSVNTSFIQFGFALGSAVGGLVIRSTSVLYLNWLGFAAVGTALLLAIVLFNKERSSSKAKIPTEKQKMNIQ
ncbi:putative MFS family arabinose efflux permease [Paenibacillus sp. PvP094]